MSKSIISENDGYDFSVTQFDYGEGRHYLINVDHNEVTLSAWQMMQLFATLLRMTRNGETI